MKKKVFISFTMADQKLAEKLRALILTKYEGDIKVYLSSKNMKGGQEWMKEIKDNLGTSSAIISLVTKNSIAKPWIYVEWAPFWLADQQFYVLKTDKVPKEALIDPMRDRNYATVNDLSSFKGFIQHMTETLLGKSYVPPVEDLDEFITELDLVLAEMASDEIKQLSSGLKKDLSNLPGDNRVKSQIAVELLKTGEKDRLNEVFNRIDEDAVKVELFDQLLQLDKPVAIELVSDAESNVLKAKVVNSLIDKHREDSATIQAIIKSIDSDIGLRRIGAYMMEENLQETDLFKFIIDNFNYNTVLKRWAEEFIKQGKMPSPTFEHLSAKLANNHIKLSKEIGLALIAAGKQGDKSFDIIITNLYTKKKRESLKELMAALKDKDPDLHQQYSSQFSKAPDIHRSLFGILEDLRKQGKTDTLDAFLELLRSKDPGLYENYRKEADNDKEKEDDGN